ncbi:hypothetical protein H0H93_012700 [Arthromyces matolae]|nr:hypothetical protein H0H93_012700 [Arthromyces matolae]
MVEYWITDIAAATLLLIIIASTAKFVHERNSKGKLAKLPPGPAGLPILGNTLQFPSKHLGTYSRSLFKKYGNFVSLQVFGSPWIFIGDMGLAKTILAKHSIKHSSRATPYYFSTHVDSMHILWALRKEVTVPRKLATGVMSSVRIGRTELLQEFEALVNVKHLLDDSGENWYHHMERVATSTVLSTAFGKHYPTGYEAGFQTLLKVFRDGVELGNPSASIVNLLPILDYIPGPMPWRTRAESFKQLQQTIFGELFEHALKGNASGVNT